MNLLESRSFQALYFAICAELGREPDRDMPVEDDAPAFEIQVDNVEFLVTYDPAGVPDLLTIRALFGTVDAQNADELIRILALNLMMSEQGSATFGVDPATLGLIYSCKGRLSTVTAATLLESLQSAARLAADWHRDPFQPASFPGELSPLEMVSPQMRV